MDMPATQADPHAGAASALPAGAERSDDIERAGRGRLFRKYFIPIFALVTSALLIPSTISLYFSYRETLDALHSVQQEKANAAAERIEQYITQIQDQLRVAALPQLGS